MGRRSGATGSVRTSHDRPRSPPPPPTTSWSAPEYAGGVEVTTGPLSPFDPRSHPPWSTVATWTGASTCHGSVGGDSGSNPGPWSPSPRRCSTSGRRSSVRRSDIDFVNRPGWAEACMPLRAPWNFAIRWRLSCGYRRRRDRGLDCGRDVDRRSTESLHRGRGGRSRPLGRSELVARAGSDRPVRGAARWWRSHGSRGPGTAGIVDSELRKRRVGGRHRSIRRSARRSGLSHQRKLVPGLGWGDGAPESGRRGSSQLEVTENVAGARGCHPLLRRRRRRVERSSPVESGGRCGLAASIAWVGKSSLFESLSAPACEAIELVCVWSRSAAPSASSPTGSAVRSRISAGTNTRARRGVCEGDLNLDGVVDGGISDSRSHRGACPPASYCRSDFDRDGLVECRTWRPASLPVILPAATDRLEAPCDRPGDRPHGVSSRVHPSGSAGVPLTRTSIGAIGTPTPWNPIATEPPGGITRLKTSLTTSVVSPVDWSTAFQVFETVYGVSQETVQPSMESSSPLSTTSSATKPPSHWSCRTNRKVGPSS